MDKYSEDLKICDMVKGWGGRWENLLGKVVFICSCRALPTKMFVFIFNILYQNLSNDKTSCIARVTVLLFTPSTT